MSASPTLLSSADPSSVRFRMSTTACTCHLGQMPKGYFFRIELVSIWHAQAVAEYNMGSLGSHIFLPASGCRLTSATTCLGQKRYSKRIKLKKAEVRQHTKLH
ncbi:hypothetical protein PoB_000696900 [Plakobranchus ocellatus]|uniref:Uncharacterized protein n=1 Tax=Plakobranchus ocellatus TaxID=259542 RepID=A0AAV3YDY1_9GAST|nr:hypothetical protein PoB_000696900 [Plakobranchus ocellatus]